MASQSDNPYAGLSDKAREECLRRMCRTLSTKPRHKKTRDYINSLTGERETPEQLRARAVRAAQKVVDAAVSGATRVPFVRDGAPYVRKDRVSPIAKARQRHATKYCRRASRFQRELVGKEPRPIRDQAETEHLRAALVAAQGALCAICGQPMREKASIDHVIPHALGGKHGLGNFVATHGECNGDKTNDVPTGCEMIWLLMVNAKLGARPVTF